MDTDDCRDRDLATVLAVRGRAGLCALPLRYWSLVGLMLVGYIALTQVVKTWFVRRYETN